MLLHKLFLSCDIKQYIHKINTEKIIRIFLDIDLNKTQHDLCHAALHNIYSKSIMLKLDIHNVTIVNYCYSH